MNEWQNTVIGEYCDLLNGYAFKSKDFIEIHQPDTLPILKIKNVANGDANLNDPVYHKTDPKLDKYKIERGDILIALTGNHPIDKTQVVGGVSQYKLPKPALLNQRVGKVYSTNIQKLSNQFLYYYLSWSRTQLYIGNQSSGSASQANISKSDVLDIPIDLPPINEQNEISDILSKLDKKIMLLSQQNETLEQIANALFKHWFVDFEFPDESGNPYKSSGGNMITSELGEIPGMWTIQSLKQNIEASKGLSYKGAGLSEKGTILHSLKSIHEGGGYRHDGIKYYQGEFKDRHIVQAGDIIVANTEQGEKHKLIGFPARIPNYVHEDSIITHHITKVVPSDNSDFTREFIYYSLLSRALRHQIISFTNGTTVNGLPTDGLQEPNWISPNKEIINDFSNLIRKIWAKQENNIKETHSLTQLRNTLLPKLMSGELRIKME